MAGFINIGFGNIVNRDKIVAVVSPDAAPGIGVLSAILRGDYDIIITTPDAALQYTVPPGILASSFLFTPAVPTFRCPKPAVRS